MFEKYEESSRGTIPFSKKEYEEICREEDKKILDSTNIESNTIDEFPSPSIDIISDNGVNNNGDFDFEVEEKPKELSPMQKAHTSLLLDLEDDVEYSAILRKILHQYQQDRKMGILNFTYGVYHKGKYLKMIEDVYYFNELNSRALEVNLDKLDKTLKMFNVKLSNKDYEDVDSIGEAIQYLIGKEVVLKQQTNGIYKNYKIVSVLDEGEV